jgi:hypothetical protein
MTQQKIAYFGLLNFGQNYMSFEVSVSGILFMWITIGVPFNFIALMTENNKSWAKVTFEGNLAAVIDCLWERP